MLQIVLCGQPELFAVLQRPELQALQQRIASTCLLRPLSLPEVRAYMAERLHAAGLRGSSPFTGTAVEVIHRLTSGVPRLINLLSDACLLVGFELKRKQIDQFLVEQASEDVLGLLKGPFAPGGLGTGCREFRSRHAKKLKHEEPELAQVLARPSAASPRRCRRFGRIGASLSSDGNRHHSRRRTPRHQALSLATATGPSPPSTT